MESDKRPADSAITSDSYSPLQVSDEVNDDSLLEEDSQHSSPSSRSRPSPLPIKKIVVLGCILAANNSSIWMIFSFLPFMVAKFFPEYSTKELGFKAGLLGSAFSTGSLFGNFIWGVIADKVGRRPALMCGLIGTAISALCFGFSPNFYLAIFSRFMWGFLNGNIGVSKTYLGEILDDSNTAKGMAMFGVIGGVGRTIGPIIGGYLSQPANHYPVFKGTIFEDFPFALPCIVISVNCVIIFTLAHYQLPETLHFSRQRVQRKKPKQQKRKSKQNPNTTYSPLNTNDDADHDAHSSLEMVEVDAKSDSSPLATSQATEPYRSGQIKKSVSFSSMVKVKEINSDRVTTQRLKGVSPSELPSIESSDEADLVESPERLSNGSEIAEGMKNTSLLETIKYLLSQNDILISTSLYGLTGFIQLAANEIYPLWVVTSTDDGGFSLNTQDIGAVSMISGPIGILSQLFLYPYLIERLGIVRVFRLAIALFAFSMFITPSLSVFNHFHSEIVVWFSLILSLSLISISTMWVLVTVFVFINNSCYSHQRGTVNGIGQSFASLGRLLGPYVGATAFAWSETNGLKWPLDYHFTWYLLGIFSLVGVRVSQSLSRNIHRRKREPKLPRYAVTMMSPESQEEGEAEDIEGEDESMANNRIHK